MKKALITEIIGQDGSYLNLDLKREHNDGANEPEMAPEAKI